MAAPVNTVLPAITYPGQTLSTAAPAVGTTLSCSTGTWTGAAPIVYTYKWQIHGFAQALPGAAPTFLVTNPWTPVGQSSQSSLGQTVECIVTATNADGSTQATATHTSAIIAASSLPSPVNTVAPAITGSSVVSKVLTCGSGSWIGATPITYAYQWQSKATGSWVSIAGETLPTHTQITSDMGNELRCVVTATDTNSSAWFVYSASSTTSLSMVSVPQILLAMRARVRQRADCVNDAHITDDELTTWINLGLAELHDILVDAYDEILTVVTSAGAGDISIVSGTSSYALPTDFYKMIGVDYLFGTSNYQMTMSRFMPRERNRYQGPFAPLITGRLIAGILVPQYRVRSQFIDVIPVPTQQMAGGKMRLLYIKQFANLVSDTDMVDASIPNGWEEFAVLSAAAAALIKQERDPSAMFAEREKIEKRIKQTADDRDAGEPMRVVDVNRLW